MPQKMKCIHCGEEFELTPNKPGKVNECPKHIYGSEQPPPPKKPKRVVPIPDKVQAILFSHKQKLQDDRLAERAKRDRVWADGNQIHRRKH
jgi:hypothetical protein